MLRLRNNELPQGFLPLELRILSRGPSRPKTYKIYNGKLLKKTFPSASSSIKLLEPPKETLDFPGKVLQNNTKIILDDKGLKILKLRGTLFHFDSNFRHAILRLHLPSWSCKARGMFLDTYKGVAGSSVKCLNEIFKQAKNLKSIILDPKCEISNLKGLRKVHSLENLSLNLEEDQVLAYPQVFKRLACLRKVRLIITPSRETVTFYKFLNFLLSLPQLEHVTIQMTDNFDHFKQLLQMIHEKKVPSFHIIRDSSTYIGYWKSNVYWRNCIDTLNLAPTKAQQVLSCENQRPQKKLSLQSPVCFQSDLSDLFEGSNTIKNLSIVDFFHHQANPSVDMAKPLFEFISKTKSLKEITMVFETSFPNYSETMNGFLKEFSQIESFESLQTLTFSLKNRIYTFSKPVPPFSGVMKNLKVLDIKLCYNDSGLFYYIKALKGLGNLEEFKMRYDEENMQKKEIDCEIPLECLRNLKKISLTFNLRFSENSTKNLIEGVHKLGNLRVLSVSPMVLMGIGSKKAEKFIENLCGIGSLESADFAWTDEENLKKVTVGILKDVKSGEIMVTKIVGVES